LGHRVLDRAELGATILTLCTARHFGPPLED
jgi:hypothetical protein